MARHFTLDEARELLPSVAQTMRGAVDARLSLEAAEVVFRGLAERVTMTGGMLANPVEFLDQKAKREAAAQMLKQAVESLHSQGVQVKDLTTGLVDFPCYYRGAEVLLCWRLGEDTIEYWHGVDEGFAGRKPIDQRFVEHHRGD